MGMTGKELLENYKKKKQENNVSSKETTKNTKTTGTQLTGAQLLDNYRQKRGLPSVQEDEKDTNGWFQKSGLFDDGYQFGDVFKTAVGSTTDLVTNLGAGILGMGESAVDAVISLAGTLVPSLGDTAAEMVKKDLYDEEAAAKVIFSDSVEKLTGIDSETDSVFGQKVDSLGQSAGQLVGTAALAYVGVPWWATTGVTTFGSETENALNQGATMNEAAFSGVVSAGAEILTEKLSDGISFGDKTLDDYLPKLTTKISNKTVRKLADLGIDMFGEGGEEVLSGVMSAIGQKLSYASDQEMSELFSSEDALDSFIGGAILSFGGSVVRNRVQAIGNRVQSISANKQANKQATELYGNGADLVTEALDIDPNNAFAQKMQAKIDKGKSLSGSDIRQLVDANESALVSQDKGKIKTATEAKLTEYGETGDVSAIADILVKQTVGEQLTSQEQNILDMSKVGQQVADELNRESLMSGKVANDWAVDIATDRVNADIYDRELYELAKQTAGVETDSVAKTVAESETAKGNVKVSESGKTTYTDAKGNTEEVSIKGIVSTKGGIKVELENGTTVSAKDLSFSTQEEALMYEMVARMEVTPETANEIINTIKPNNVQEATMYFDSVPLAYQYGKMNYEAGLQNIALPENQKRIAYNRGRMDAVVQDKANTKPTSKKGSTKASANKDGIIFEHGYVYDESTASEIQKASMIGIETINQMSNLEVHVFESKVVNGKRVAYVNGKLVSAPNGYFTKGNEIYIDINAGNKGEGAMLYTMSHEILHYIREWNAKGFRELGDFLIEQYGKKGIQVDALLDEQKEKFKKRYEREKNPLPSEAKLADMAYEELVADAMSDMFTDPKAYEKLAKLKQQNRTLWQKLGEAIKALLDKLKTALGIYKTDINKLSVAEEAFHVRGFSKDVYEKLQDLYIKAFVEADANYEASESSKKTASEDVKHSEREDDVATKINQSMTMAEAKRMIESAYKVNGIAEYYEGEYSDAEDWLKKAGSDEVEMYIENDFDLQAKYVNSNEDILNEEYRIADVLDAYLAGTLVGKEKPKAKRLDVSKSTRIKDSRFYSPQKIEDAKKTFELAKQKAVGKNANSIIRARAEILLFAHNKGAAELLGITQSELNKKLRSWSNYSATAKNISEKINAGVAEENRWTGIENSSYINKAKVTNEDIERLVASVEGDSKGYERKYIARVMLAADTHIDYSGLKFKFASSQQVNQDNNSSGRVHGFYRDDIRLIEVTHDKPHTVAHEMGHYIDAQWGRDLLGSTTSSHLFLTRGINENMVRDRYGEQGVQFLKNFKMFINSLTDVNSNYSSYTNDRAEVFARFFARFVEWTDNIATGNRYYSYESSMYNDKFTQAQYVEFVRLLQEKALLDGSINSSEETAKFSLRDTVEDDVLNHYGKTYKWIETGYIFKDGTRLDLSGRNEGASGGYRTVDHRDIFNIYEDSEDYGTDAMVEFMSRGNIRVMPESPGINLQVEPTQKQYEQISSMVESLGWKHKSFTVDFDNANGYTIDSLSYEGNVSARKVVADIKYFFKEGKIPYQSDLSQFRYSDRDSYAPTFYSHMGKVIDGIRLEKMGANGVVSYLKGKGVKDEEIKWSGIESFLEGKKSVTKAELQEFVAGSQLQIVEHTSGTATFIADDGNTYKSEAAFKDAAYAIADKNGIDRSRVKFIIDTEYDMDAYAYVGHPNNSILTAEVSEAEGTSPRWSQYKLDGGENYRELVFTMPNSSYSNKMMSAHWGEDAEGVLAHTRIQDMTTSDGKKMLFVEEIQSDWHNEGHQKGYELGVTKDNTSVFLEENNYYLSTNFDKRAANLNKYYAERVGLTEEQIHDELIEKYNEEHSPVPDAPFRNNYHEYVLKRLLRMAAEEGYDSLGWTTADIQSKRWSEEFAEGYRIEYDQDIPKFLRKYGKKWGVTVGRATVNDTQVWSMDITDSMKDSVLHEGQVLYSDRYQTVDENSDILSLIERVESGKFKANEKVFLGTVSDSIARQIENLTGINVNGFNVAIEARQIEHILKDHGKQGLTDKSMADTSNIAKMEFALNAPDDIRKAGKTQAYTHMVNGKNRTADTVLYEKEIGEKSYYVVQAVPDTKAKTLYIVTAFIGKKGYKKEASQLINAKSLDVTAKTGSADASVGSISQNEKIVNSKFSERDDFNQVKSNLQKKYHIDTNDVLALANRYLTNYTGSSNKTNIRLQFLRVTEPLAEIFATGNTDLLQEATKRAEVLATDIEQARATGTDHDLVAIKNYLRKTRIQIPTFYKADFDRLGGLSEFRKRHMGKFILSKDGIQVDSLYPELQELFGTVWFPDIDTVPDQLMRIAEVSDTSAESVNESEYDIDLAIEYLREQIMSEVSDLVMKSMDRQSNSHIDYRDTNVVSNRTLLANALESVAQNDIEKNKLNQYKAKISLIESEQKKLNDIRAKANELRFTKGRTPAETKQMRDLDAEANQIANRISTYDKQLLNLESTTALKNVLEREKAMLRKKLEQKGKEVLRTYKEKNAKTVRELMTRYQESRKKAIEGRHKTEMRHKIKKVVSELNQLLLHGSKERNVKLGLQQAVASALDAINMDTVGADARIAKYNDLIAKANDPDVIESLKATRDRIQAQGDSLGDKLRALKDAYYDIQHGEEGKNYPAYFKEEASLIEQRIQSVIKVVGNTSLRDMSLKQLNEVYDMYKMVLTTIQNANSVWKEGRAEDLQQNASAVMQELEKLKKLKGEGTKMGEALRSFSWNEMTPYYAFDRIGSKTFTSFFWEAIKGQNVYANDVAEAKAFASNVRGKYGYKKWDLDKVYQFKLKDGRTFEVTLKHMLSIYAYSKRDQALPHMSTGGFFFNDKSTFRKKGGILELIKRDDEGYKIDAEILAEIKDAMTKEQLGYVDEMQEYLTKMGEKGNEVTRVLWGIDIFKEKVYFPLKSKDDFIKKSTETAQSVSLKNDGMTKETVPGASNPIVLEAFDDVWSSHIDRMSQYHAFVIPIDNLNKIHQYGTWSGTASMSVSTMLTARFGSAANEYISQFIKDLNGNVVTQGAKNPLMGFLSKFKKTAVGFSLSTIVQQPTAILRAMALVDAKYFVGKPSLFGLSQKWAELKKYAPIAIIKDIGGFDAGSGVQVSRWLNSDSLTGIDKVMNTIDDVSMKGAEVADKMGWASIWEAVKREVKATTNLEVGSEAFLKKAGERFTEVIVKTQVYDSTLSRSGFMRSKGDLMKMLTAFMGEPTLSINMMFNAIVNVFRGGSKAQAARTIGFTYASIIAASALASLIYALRDDDEDESYAEKYSQSFGGQVVDDVVLAPLTSLPAVKDIVSIFQGWDVERTDVAIFKDIKDAFDGLDSENKSGYRKVEDFAGAIAAAFGLPLKNLLRTGREVYNAFDLSFDGISGGNMGGAFVEGVTGKESSKTDNLYDVIVNGDKSRLEVLKKSYKTKDAYETAVRKALRENDSRIHEAAQARYDGDISKYTRIAKAIIAEGKFSQDTVVGAINAEITAIKKGETTEIEETEEKDEVTSIYSASDINAAFEYEDTETALQIIDDLIETKVANGMEADKAKSSVRSSMTSYWKPLYKQAYQSGYTTEMLRIRRILLASGLYGSSNDVVKTVNNWLKS